MPLSVGDKLGPYEILAPIGKGGMGEVYRAHDSRLNRDVAIKVSSAEFTERFSREARLIASLNHPNICTLHDVGPNYLVMELIEGPTLAERITLGRIPWEESLGIVVQMVAALEAAHEKGIVHRDFKPGNIKIKPDGTVKVLDFGLAKAGGMPRAQPSEDSPTMSMAATEAGVILGTVAYMSPEQAKGRPVDKRADIWAFGVVLYEMLTAQRPFRGETVSETLASVLKEDPVWDSVPVKTRRLIRTCLRKDSKQRLQDIADAKLLLEDEPFEAITPSLSRHGMVAWGVAALCFLGVLALGWVHFRENPRPAPEQTRLQVPLPAASNVIALSPDGRRLAYSGAGPDGRTSLWVREMSTLEPHRLVGTEGIVAPFFWSPDSLFLVFQTEGKLKKIDASGGPSQPLWDTAENVIGGSWSRDGVIVFGYPGGSTPGIRRLPMAGGTPILVTNHDDIFPSFLPDGRHFIYLRFGAPDTMGIYLGSMDVKPEEQSTKRLLATKLHAQYVPSEDPTRGHILFMRDGTLMNQPFDVSRLELAGEPVPVAERVGDYLGSALYSASDSGVLAYRGGTGGMMRLSWFDRQGKPHGFAGEPASYNDVTLSPDGSQAAIGRFNLPNMDILVYDIARSTSTRLTSVLGSNLAPVWSPDGNRIAFNRGVLNWKASSGTGQETVLLKRDAYPNDWSRDGRFLLYTENDPKTGSDLWVLPLTGEPQPMVVLNTQSNERQGQFSPDGHWIAYISDESGKPEVYIQSFPPSDGGQKHQISQAGGDQPRWRGNELFFLSPNETMMAVDVSTARGKFTAGIPSSLFPLTGVPRELVGPTAFHWDTADGKKFLIGMNAEGAPEPATIVQNWMAGLPKK